MNLFLKELKQYRVTFIVWSLTIAALTLMTMAAMPAMFQNQRNLQDFIKMYPPELMRAFSFNVDSFSNPLGFFAVYAAIYVLLLGSVFSATVGAGIVHKEQSGHTAEFLLAKPLSRLQIIGIKMAAYATLVTALNIVTTVASWLCLKAFASSFDQAAFFTFCLYGFALVLSMGALGLLVSLLVRRARSLTGLAIGIALAFYFIDFAAKITKDYDAVGWVSPFKWVNVDITRPGYALDWWRLAAFAGLIVACAASSIIVYRRKDVLT